MPFSPNTHFWKWAVGSRVYSIGNLLILNKIPLELNHRRSSLHWLPLLAPKLFRVRSAVFLLLCCYASLRSVQAQNLQGFVDMHAHPMAHLGFSGKFLHGAPDIGCLIPTDPDCRSMVRATSMAHALGDCNATHGGHDLFTNGCGDHLRAQFIGQLESANGAQSNHGRGLGGAEKQFPTWPACNDISHQTMWVEWIRRCHAHGQRVMVALAVNSETVAAALAGPGDLPSDDRSTVRLQIEEIKAMVARHPDFMEVAYTAAQLRTIVEAGKMAIVLGVEVDNLGNLNTVNGKGKLPTESQVDAALDEIWELGVRYAFPIHVIDNVFGGTALMESFFNVANYRESGHCWQPETAATTDSVDFRFSPPLSQFMLDMLKIKIGCNLSLCPESKALAEKTGQVNALGLTALGQYALLRMMRMGIMIDIDHMSQKAANQSLTIAENHGHYPINSGHNGLRDLGAPGHRNENSRTRDQVRRIRDLGGMMGMGMAPDAAEFLRQSRILFALLGHQQCAIGTDMNGMVTQPKPRQKDVDGTTITCSEVEYSSEFPPCKTESRTWDYNREGVAHYGLIPDYFQDVRNLGGDQEVEALFRGAEGFARMWERCEQIAKK
jgi:microsomal dipeptidase-like Zn-dependent dipeptidase